MKKFESISFDKFQNKVEDIKSIYGGRIGEPTVNTVTEPTANGGTSSVTWTCDCDPATTTAPARLSRF